ncbi:MAG: trans-aconitate methyltransferase [Gammaproteobacteria bacterium]
MSAPSGRFDRQYYERFYADPETCSVTGEEVARQIAFVAAYLKHMALGVRRVLDLGCGLGMMQAPLLENFPGATYQGVEFSEYLCEELGWQRGSVVDYRARTAFDLVVCHDVIQYLDDHDADRAIGNLATLCRGALYLGVLTAEDWQENCDPQRTDNRVELRTTDWYRTRLARHFVSAGGGVFLKSDAPVVLWSLERGG